MDKIHLLNLFGLQRFLIARIDEGIQGDLKKAHRAFQDGTAYEFIFETLKKHSKNEETVDAEFAQLINNWFHNFTNSYNYSKFGIHNNGLNWAVVLLSRWLEEIFEDNE